MSDKQLRWVSSDGRTRIFESDRARGDSSAHVLQEALEAMREAHRLLAGEDKAVSSLLERSEVALTVLECGIARAAYALNLTDREPG